MVAEYCGNEVRIVILFIILTLLLFSLVAVGLVFAGLLGDVSAFALGGFIIMICELVAVYIMEKSGYLDESTCGGEEDAQELC